MSQCLINGIRKKCYTTVVAENRTEMSTNITERIQICYYFFFNHKINKMSVNGICTNRNIFSRVIIILCELILYITSLF